MPAADAAVLGREPAKQLDLEASWLGANSAWKRLARLSRRLLSVRDEMEESDSLSAQWMSTRGSGALHLPRASSGLEGPIAEPYPAKLCAFLGRRVASDVLETKERARLDNADCAKTGSLRVGKASNPQPRKRIDRKPAILTKVPLLEPATLQVRDKYWSAFRSWIEDEAGNGSFELVCWDVSALLPSAPSTCPEAAAEGSSLHEACLGSGDPVGNSRTSSASSASS